MSTIEIMKRRNLHLSPEKPFHLPVYAEKMASAFAEFGSSNPKRRKHTYALNVLNFIDGSASEGKETSESSSPSAEGSATESTAT